MIPLLNVVAGALIGAANDAWVGVLIASAVWPFTFCVYASFVDSPRLALLPHCVVLNGKGRYDYGQLVATAADRLRADLQGMVNVLTKEHIAP